VKEKYLQGRYKGKIRPESLRSEGSHPSLGKNRGAPFLKARIARDGVKSTRSVRIFEKAGNVGAYIKEGYVFTGIMDIMGKKAQRTPI